MIINQVHGEGCSTGFGVHSTVDSKTYMLTAEHCGNDGDTFKNGQQSETLGPMYGENASHDDGAILASVGDAYYDGNGILDGDTHNTKLVAGQQSVNPGDWVCESGAAGGVVCNLQVPRQNGTNQTWTYCCDDHGDTLIVFPMAVTNKGSGGVGQGLPVPGDSGGPVFSLAGGNEVTAKGIAVAGTDSQMGFMPISVISTDFKVMVNTP